MSIGTLPDTGSGKRASTSVAAQAPKAGRPTAPEALLGTTRINPPQGDPVAPWWVARRLRYQRRQTSSGWLIGAARIAAGLPADITPGTPWVEPARPARCRWRVAEAVGVHWSAGRPAHWSGIERCASIWACPVCSAVIRHGRSMDVQAAADEWAKRGGTCVMATVTLRHKVADPLAVTLDQALKGWDGVVKHKPWKAIKAAYGVIGYVRAVEVTRGAVNGWHPHIHALLFLAGKRTEKELGRLELDLFMAWQGEVVKQGGRGLSPSRGVRVTRAGSAAYVAKVQEHDRVVKAGVEMTRFDLKGGRQSSVTPFELLDEPGGRRLWLEYFEATKGRRAITWSRGLRAMLGLDAEVTDAELIASTETLDLVGVLSADDYDQIRNRPTVLAELLEIVEALKDPASVV